MLRKGRVAVRLVVVLVFVAASAGSLFYARPVEFYRGLQHLWMTVDGVTGRDVTVGGHRIHYYVRGPVGGAPVVLVHGRGGRAEDWLRLAPYLVKAGYRVYTPDLLGYGESERPVDATYSIPEEAGAVLGFLDAVGLKQVDLVGWSMGGWIAQRVAWEHPERVRRLTLMNSAGLKLAPEWDTRLFTPTRREDIDQLGALLFPHPQAVPEFVARDVLRVSAEDGWVVKRALGEMLSARDVTDGELPGLKMPVLLLWGDLDRITPLSEGRTMRELVPGSRLEIAPGCGHMAPEQCAGSYGPEVVRFLGAEPELAAGEVTLRPPV